MDVLISTVGTSLLTYVMQHDATLTVADDEVFHCNAYKSVAPPELDAVLQYIARVVHQHPDMVFHTDEVQSIRKYVQRTTGHQQIILPNTDYILVVPNTAVGLFCAECIKSALCAHDEHLHVVIVPLTGLISNAVECLEEGWNALRTTIDCIRHHYKSDVIYNVSGDYTRFAGLFHAYATQRGGRIIYAIGDDAALCIIDVHPTGHCADVSFFETLGK